MGLSFLFIPATYTALHKKRAALLCVIDMRTLNLGLIRCNGTFDILRDVFISYTQTQTNKHTHTHTRLLTPSQQQRYLHSTDAFHFNTATIRGVIRYFHLSSFSD